MRLRKYIIFFLLYAVLGWCYEVFLEVIVYQWGFSNRGVLFGPYTPVYGFGGVLFIVTIYPLIKEQKWIKKLAYLVPVFLGCMIVATLLELGTSYLLEWVTGSWPWQTYVDYKYNFQGRIALSPSIRFGIGGVIFLYLIQPIFELFVKKLNEKQLTMASIIIIIIFILDILYTFFVM